MNPSIVSCAILFTAVLGVNAQKTTKTPASGLPSPTTTTNNNTITPASGATTNNTVQRPVYLSGKVVLQDGTPPPDIVKIERICAGRPRPQGYTDMKGHFQFQVDSLVGIDTDASDPMTRTSSSGGSRPSITSDLAACDLRAVLPGFVSGTISLASHIGMDNPDVGIIVLRRTASVDGSTVSMLSLNAPKDALKAYEKGRELLKKEKPEEAERSFQKAVGIYPKYAAAWYQLGMLQSHGDPAQAEISFTRAVEADPKFVSPYLRLALIYEKDRRWEKSLELSDAIIKLNSTDFPQAHFYKAVAQYNLRDEVAAEKTVRKAIELDVRHEFPQSEKLLGFILAQHNDLAGAAEHLQKYLDLAPNASDAKEVRARLTSVEQQAMAVKHF